MRKAMRKAAIFIVAALLLMVGATPVYANGVPPLPHAFYGDVTINGSPAPIGTTVEARGTGVLTGIEGNPITTTEPGKYGSANSSQPRLIVQGDILDGAVITFYVNGVSTEQTTEWHSGYTTELDLAVAIAAPPGGGGGGGGGAADTTPPTISGISVSGITETSADISWKTNEKSDTQVEYWSSPSKLSPLDETMLISHLVHLTDLTPGTTYHYKIMSRDASDNLSVSDENTFTTLPGPVQNDLTISSTAGGKVTTPGEGTFSYDAGAVVNLVAEPDQGYRFVNWTGDVAIIADVSAASTTITMDGDYSITANFEAIPYGLTISSTAGGKVTTPGEGTFSYDAGAVDLVAEPDQGYRFVNWTGDVATIADVSATSTTITMDSDYSITANFEAIPPPNWPLIGGIIAGVIVLGLLIFFLVRRRAT